jgi:hypothetical protein
MKNPFVGVDLNAWMALRRVSKGGITTVGDQWLHSGRRVPGYIADALTELLAGGLVALADVDLYGMRRSAFTDAGAAHYEGLCQQRQAALTMPAAQFNTTGKRADVDDPDPLDGRALPH